ncbi:hypothetical protein GCM10025751_37640 [Haladaptatus pallidirubidus]|uniref:Uncharacterized protein n=1 Tax=Haladaptatus pallidirubidus TaxID=1008152 RepID=A0AAV3UL67_9EURY
MLFNLGELLLYAGLILGAIPSGVAKSPSRLAVALATFASVLVVLVPIIAVLRLTE